MSHNEFYNVSVDDITFNIIIDKSTIKPIYSDSLKNTIQDYGSILIKITEDTIDKILLKAL